MRTKTAIIACTVLTISLLAASGPVAAQSLPDDDECSVDGIVMDSAPDEILSAPGDPGIGTTLNLAESAADNCADGEVDGNSGIVEREIDTTVEAVDSFLNPDEDDIEHIDDLPECGEDVICI